jgi:4'-phosphopantetheinyl transferase
MMTRISLLSNHAYIWTQHIGEIDQKTLDHQAQYLSIDECERADRFVHEDDKKRLIIAYSGLRVLLSKCLFLPPACLKFKMNAHGKPYLPNASICFNLSHSKNWIVWAIAMNNVVGVDVEYQRGDIDLLSLAKRFFAKEEFEAIKSTKPIHRLSAFYRCWTRKESYIKAIGKGLSYPLDNFSVPIQKEIFGYELRANESKSDHEKWYLYSLDMPRKYTGALVLQKKVDKIQYNNTRVFELDK